MCTKKNFYTTMVLIYFFFCLFLPIFQRKNPTKANLLYVSDYKRLDKSNLNKTNPLVLYLHGFSERAPGGSGQSSQEVRDGKENFYLYLIIYFIVNK